MRYLAMIVATFLAALAPALGHPSGHPSSAPWCKCHCCQYDYQHQHNNQGANYGDHNHYRQSSCPGPKECPYGHPKCPANSSETVSSTNAKPSTATPSGSKPTNPTTKANVKTNPGEINSKHLKNLSSAVSNLGSLAYASWPTMSLLGLLVVPALIRRR